MKRLPNIWLDNLKTFDQAVKQLEDCLTVLKHNSKISDFRDAKIRKRYGDDVMFMKQFFERAEFLARNSK